MNHSEIVSFLWGVADLIRDTFRRGHYQDVILPLTVLRRLDCVLADTKEKVLKRQAELKGKGLEHLDAQLRHASGLAFYNTSRYDFEKLLGDAPHLTANLRNYIAGFSPNMREVLEKFDFDNTIAKLDEAGLLYLVLERFKQVDLHPDKVDNPTMGTIFEELIRKFNEALNENPGEHFTPRDVVHLMATLRWSLKENRQDDKGVTHAVLKTIAAFLNTEGGDLLIGVADDGSIVGIEADRLESDDRFMRHLAQVVRNGLGDRAGTCIDPKTQVVRGKTVCVVSCQRSPEPVFLKWKGMETNPDGDFFVRSGPGTVKLPPESAREYIRTRFPNLASAGGAGATT